MEMHSVRDQASHITAYRRAVIVAFMGVVASSHTLPAHAHAFGKTYAFPVPVWMYLYGAAFALLSSIAFLMVWKTAGTSLSTAKVRSARSGSHRAAKWLHAAAFSLAWVAGWIGMNNAYLNFGMTFFWIVFFLGYLYWAALRGSAFEYTHPIRSLIQVVESFTPVRFKGLIHPPDEWIQFFSIIAYAVVLWLEFFTNGSPRMLSWFLTVYLCMGLLGAWLVGVQRWFAHGDFFSMYLNTASMLSPYRYRSRNRLGTEVIRERFDRIGLGQTDPLSSLAFTVFVIMMLASTAFDGIKETVFWKSLYWEHFHGWLAPRMSDNPSSLYGWFAKMRIVFDSISLLLFIVLYGAAYVLVLKACARIARRTLPAVELARLFAVPMVPIAFVYNFAHYFGLLFSQGISIARLTVDPFGFGWDLGQVKSALPLPFILDTGWLWHIQVGAIVAGHVMSAYWAHKTFTAWLGTHLQARIAQAPMALFMTFLTAFGLWILAQPVLLSCY